MIQLSILSQLTLNHIYYKSVKRIEVIMAQYSENNNHYHKAVIIHHNNIETNDLIFKQ